MRVDRLSVTLEAVTAPARFDAEAGFIEQGRYALASCADVGDSLSSRVIELAARTCYKSEEFVGPGSASALVSKLKKSGHHAMLEFCDATFRIVCDRGVSHEIVRHRLSSYAQESTRFCNYSKGKFGGEISVIPMYDGLSDSQIARREALYRHIEEVYLAELAEGLKPQQARDNLPTCLKTEIVVKMNFRNWLHFLDLRTSPKAHPQMRKIALEVGVQLRKLCPEVFSAETQRENCCVD